MYIKVGKKKIDVLENGDLSCAFFVTVILHMFGLIKEIHTTVNGTIEDMEKTGWKEVKKPKIGDVLIWEKKKQTKRGGGHRHVGFYIGNEQAISNNFKLGVPKINHITYSGKRKVEKIFRHESFTD